MPLLPHCSKKATAFFIINLDNSFIQRIRGMNIMCPQCLTLTLPIVHFDSMCTYKTSGYMFGRLHTCLEDNVYGR